MGVIYNLALGVSQKLAIPKSLEPDRTYTKYTVITGEVSVTAKPRMASRSSGTVATRRTVVGFARIARTTLLTAR